jgi:hypothetical protein
VRPIAAALDLSPGAELVLDGVQWRVERREPHLGQVHLVAADGAWAGGPGGLTNK